jgi:hypothetical protein
LYTIYEITKCDYGFPYSKLVKWFTKDEISKYCNSFRQQCSKITKFWKNKTNAEWSMRYYFAVKMILSASIMISSADYSRTKNIRITEPYLYYYSILSCCRVNISTKNRLSFELASAPNSKMTWSFKRSLMG